jgi:hypothetical protein
VRLAYRISYLVCIVSGSVAASLASAFRELAHLSRRWGVLVVPLQLPLLAAWYPARVVSLSSFAVCQTLAARIE